MPFAGFHPEAGSAADDAAWRGWGQCWHGGHIGRLECAGVCRRCGSVIRHQPAPCAVSTLMIAMVEASLNARLVPRPCCPNAPASSRTAALVRAIRVAPVARGTDGKRPMAGAAGSLAERRFHGAASNDRRSCWTPVPIRGTKEGDCLGPMEPEVVTGARRSSPGPHLSSRSAQPTSAASSSPSSKLRVSRSWYATHASRGAPRPLRGLGACHDKSEDARLTSGAFREDSDFCGSTRSPTRGPPV